MSEVESNIQEKLDKDQDTEELEKELLEEEFIEGITSNKNRVNNIIKELNNIQNKIKINNNKKEQIKKNLVTLKNEKNKQQIDLINLLSKKESIEEIYKNKIFSLNNKNENIINNSNTKNQLEIFNITSEDFKKIEIDKYIEKVISMTDDILAKCGEKYNKKDIMDNLTKIIKNSYEIFIHDSSEKNLDFILDHFISKISLYISNQSFGKFSEKDISICLRYLLDINIINEALSKMNKFLNKQYKDKKIDLKMEKSLWKNSRIIRMRINYIYKILILI